MTLKIRNWKLALLTLVLMGFFTSLGCWQLYRAEQKNRLMQAFSQRTRQAPLSFKALNRHQDLRFYQITLTGYFDNAHTLFLDNKTMDGKIGYEIYTPFKVIGLSQAVLIDRGFIPLGQTRQKLPLIQPINGKVTLLGMLNTPPAYVSFGEMEDRSIRSWPRRVEFIHIDKLSTLIGYPLYQNVINISPDDQAALAIKWQILVMGPEKHRGYALQWFAFTLTLLILFASLGIQLKP